MSYVDTIEPPETLSDLEVTRLLKVSGEHRNGYRDHMIFSVALGAALRIHEIAALTCSDVYGPQGTVRQSARLRVFKGKSRLGTETQSVVIAPNTRVKLAKFREWKIKEGEPVNDDAPLFMSQRRKALSVRMLSHIFATWQREAGFEKLYGFHALRHTACTDLYRRTKDLVLVKKYARHRSTRSTEIYTHATADDLRESLTRQRC